MNLKLQKSKINSSSPIKISGSKSETNRLLLLQALYPEIAIENTSNSDDSEAMQNALDIIRQDSIGESYVIDVHHAGTAMRFLTAFFAIQTGKEITITGSTRMKERPIKILVEALRELGADIEYLENDGYPPLKIKGTKLFGGKIGISSNVSSQYISALLLIAPKLENGLELTLEGEITSVPYIKMTLELLSEVGIEYFFEGNIIKISPKAEIVNPNTMIVESDWSSASYWYSIVALSEVGTQVTLSSYKKNSLQGDAVLSEIYQDFGVQTIFNGDNTITIIKKSVHNFQSINHNLNNCPDIAQTIAVTSFALGISCDLYGLHTLKIKETDRLEALKVELRKFGATIKVSNDSLHLENSNGIVEDVTVKTYQDHRMAMAFAPLALCASFNIEDAEVVSKSYPDFWNDLERVGFNFSIA